jgi:hypothetical protein
MRRSRLLAVSLTVAGGLALVPPAQAAAQQAWLTQTDSGPTSLNNDDSGDRVAIDGAGNVVIAGRAGRFAESARLLVAKFDANGNPLWRRVIDATAPAIFDGDLFLGVDGAGNAILVWQESIWSGGVQLDAPIRLAKLDAAGGSDLWRATYDPSDFVDLADFAATPDGGFVFVGTSSGNGNSGLALTAKVGSGGTVQWEDRFATPGQHVAQAFAVAVNPSTGAIAVGGNDRGSMNDTKSLVILYDGAGHASWSKRISSNQKMDEDISDVAFTPAGNVVASGRRLSRTAFHIEGLVYELRGSNGKLDWSRFSDATLDHVEFRMVRADASGNVVVAGFSGEDPGTHTFSDRLVARFLADGTPVWSQIQDLRPEDAIGGLALDAAGNAYTTGYATDFNLADPTVWVTSRYDAATGHAWDVFLDVATSFDWDKGNDIAVTPAGEIVVTGRTLNVVSPPTFSGDATTIKYTQN